MFIRICVSFLALSLSTASSATHAQGEPFSPTDSPIDSIVIGALAHEVAREEEDGIDANLEVRLRPVFGKTWAVEILPTIGGAVNFNGGTNAAYAGATARYRLTEALFIEGFFGLTVHDADTPSDAATLDLGCTVLFREGAGIGYRIEQHALGVYISHASHGDILCDSDKNDGMTSVGLRYGFHF